MLPYSRLQRMPKVDLHRHFEGSLRLETLVEIARNHDVGLPFREANRLRPLVQVTTEKPSMEMFLGKFVFLRRFYRSPEIIHRLATEIVADAASDNVRYLELRFSPQALSAQCGFPLDQVTDWVIAAVKRASQRYGIEVNLIVTLVRHETVARARRVAEIAFERIDQGIVGLDLAGNEVEYSAQSFRDIFVEAKRQGMGITVHAGEWMGAETVTEAVTDLRADRIGHGVHVINDHRAVKMLIEKNILLEMCITSNLQTGAVSSIRQHPVARLHRMGVPVTLNTDDPAISGITLSNEYELGMRALGLTPHDLHQMTITAIHNSFATAEQKVKLLRQFNRYVPRSPQSTRNAADYTLARNLQAEQSSMAFVPRTAK